MRVTRLKLVNVRAVEVAEFHFRPDYNLIAGVNGVGKTTVLDTLAVCLSVVVRLANGYSRPGRFFEADDIRVGVGALQAECYFECAGKKHGYLLQRSRDRNPVNGATEWSRENEKTYNSPPVAAVEQLYGGLPTDGIGGKPEGQVLAVLFSTNRLFVSFTAVDRLRKVHPLAPRLGAPGVAVVGPRAAWPHRAGTEFGRHRLFLRPEWIHEREGSKTSTGAGKDARFYRRH